MAKTIPVDQLAEEVMKGLTEYAALATDDMKSAVKKAAKTVQSDIKSNAPKRTGRYAKSWAVKTQKETSNSLEQVVYSKDRYQIAHLLEHGHAKRGGGRVAGRPHIAPAEAVGEELLVQMIEKALKG